MTGVYEKAGITVK